MVDYVSLFLFVLMVAGHVHGVMVVTSHRRKIDRHMILNGPSPAGGDIETREQMLPVKHSEQTYMDQNFEVVFLIQDHIQTQKHLFAKSLASVISKEMGFDERLYEIGQAEFSKDGTTQLHLHDDTRMEDTYKHLPYPQFLNGVGCGATTSARADFLVLTSIFPKHTTFDSTEEIYKDQITVVITEGCQFCNSLRGSTSLPQVSDGDKDSLLLIAVDPSRICKHQLNALASNNDKFEVISLRNWMDVIEISNEYPISSGVVREKLMSIMEARTRK